MQIASQKNQKYCTGFIKLTNYSGTSKMKLFASLIIAAVVGLTSAKLSKRAAQNPGVWSALDSLRGKSKLGNDDILQMVLTAKAGQDYPDLSEIPAGSFDCTQHSPGFYADVDSRCQVYRRCDVNGNQTAYLCPNMTVFNQITLTCHWFWDVDCSKSTDFYDYSNSRLYQNVPLLDDEPSYTGARRKRAAQNPGVFTALDQLRGKSKLGNDDILQMVLTAKPGQDYPDLSEIPAGSFDCTQHSPGFYADVESRCQVVRRCDVNGNQTAYLCPNMTVFNQITLTCHWFWDVDCSKSTDFYDYSNSRLYQNVPLLDDEPSYTGARRKRAAQNPGVYSALDQLRGKSKLSNDDILQMFVNSKAGQDYPNLSEIPPGNFDCSQHAPGFYADVDTRCQVVRRCDVNGNQTAYLCPNMTVFNQITLVCHWFWDVDCSKSTDFYEYSNSRLYQNVALLDDEPSYTGARRKRAANKPRQSQFVAGKLVQLGHRN
ncbi:uncharacterized protein LOC129589729 [Paramacrobiotus metropolitanus]|uniref:uncharacterized protein LOC129589729 n=1 Tax=Paramacrobiotus metropolitanus TaxID=2943436 RepID=UPI002445B15D|nr:uncharacterized protein LOC129589729 [Paramacrobiotus metropolitanus]